MVYFVQISLSSCANQKLKFLIIMITNEQGRRQDDKERKGNTPKRIGNQKLKFLIIVITNEQGRYQREIIVNFVGNPNISIRIT